MVIFLTYHGKRLLSTAKRLKKASRSYMPPSLEYEARKGGEADFSSAFQSRLISVYVHDR